jgi:hypothetical protein
LQRNYLEQGHSWGVAGSVATSGGRVQARGSMDNKSNISNEKILILCAQQILNYSAKKYQ